MSTSPKSSGFTLIELMVAISIILIMLSILATSFIEARQNSRDRERVSDLGQVEFALQAYFDVKNEYPTEAGTLGQLPSVDDLVRSFMGGTIVDPLNKDSHSYYYDPEFQCKEGEGNYVALIATDVEVSRNSNATEICPDNSTYANGYIVLVGGPFAPGASHVYEIEAGNGEEWWTKDENQYQPTAPAASADTCAPSDEQCTCEANGGTYVGPGHCLY